MPNKSYTVLFGTFRQPDSREIGQGGVIELPDDVAERFRNQLEEVAVELSLVTQPAGEGGRKAAAAKAGQDA